MSDIVNLQEAALHALVTRAFVRHGASPANAVIVAAVVAAAERDGAKSHGLLRLPGFIASLQAGHADGIAVPRIEHVAPAFLAVDGGNGFAQVALAAVHDQAVKAARAMGLAAVSIRDTHHFSALWPDVEGFAERGLVALSMVNSRPYMVSWGSRTKVFGTNPMAFACPRADGPPIVWDQASSTRAQGEVLLARNAGHAVPTDFGVDAQGRETTDPAAILDGGALLPFSGAKGGNVAFMVEVMVAALGGAPFGFEVAPETHTGRTGQFVLLIDPASDGRTGFAGRVDQLVAMLEASGVSRLPAERRYRNRERARTQGIDIPQSDYDALLAFAG